jgi:hypothetical protein
MDGVEKTSPDCESNNIIVTATKKTRTPAIMNQKSRRAEPTMAAYLQFIDFTDHAIIRRRV